MWRGVDGYLHRTADVVINTQNKQNNVLNILLVTCFEAKEL
jgi:hypothetical protein